MNKYFSVVMCVLLLPGMVSCGYSKRKKLERYMEEIKQSVSKTIEPIPSYEPHDVFVYPMQARRDPFQPLMPTADIGIPDANRLREPLESYPLDALHMVGILQHEGQLWALITTPDGFVHRVTLGNYLGQHDGKILQITDEAIALEEKIPRGNGWESRSSILTLLSDEKST